MKCRDLYLGSRGEDVLFANIVGGVRDLIGRVFSVDRAARTATRVVPQWYLNRSLTDKFAIYH